MILTFQWTIGTTSVLAGSINDPNNNGITSSQLEDLQNKIDPDPARITKEQLEKINQWSGSIDTFELLNQKTYKISKDIKDYLN